MSQSVNPKIGSGFQDFYQRNAGSNHGPTDLVAIANWENAVPSIGGRVSNLTLSNTAPTQIPTSGNYPYRRTISISNANSSGTLWIGFSSGVTTANGYPLLINTSKDFNLAATIDLWAVGSTSGTDIRILELA